MRYLHLCLGVTTLMTGAVLALPAQDRLPLRYRFEGASVNQLSDPSREQSVTDLIGTTRELVDVDLSDLERWAFPTETTVRIRGLITLLPVDSAQGTLWRVGIDSLGLMDPIGSGGEVESTSPPVKFSIFMRADSVVQVGRIKVGSSSLIHPISSNLVPLLQSVDAFLRPASGVTPAGGTAEIGILSDLPMQHLTKTILQATGDTLHTRALTQQTFWDAGSGTTILSRRQADSFRVQVRGASAPSAFKVMSTTTTMSMDGTGRKPTSSYQTELTVFTLLRDTPPPQ